MSTNETNSAESIPSFPPTGNELREIAIRVATENIRDAGIGDKNVIRHFNNFLSHVRVACYGQTAAEVATFLLAQFAVYLVRQIKRK